MLPCIRNPAPPRTADEQLIESFFSLSPARRGQILAWRDGSNISSYTTLVVGGHQWRRIGKKHDWTKYYDLFERCVPGRAEMIHAATVERERVAANELAQLEREYGDQFADYRRRIMAGESVVTYFGRTYDPLPIISRQRYDYRKEHACITCGATFDHGVGDVYYVIAPTCGCDPGGQHDVYEFEWDFINP